MTAPRGIAVKLTSLAQSLGRWLDGSGPSSDIVLSTRVRLARNLKEVPFTHRAREEQMAMVYSSVVSAVRKTSGPRLVDGALQMRELTPLDRQFLVERHLISHDLRGQRPPARASFWSRTRACRRW